MNGVKEQNTALGLLFISLLFFGMVTGVFLGFHRLETETILDQEILDSLQKSLLEHSEDEHLKEAYRRADTSLRRVYFLQQRRLKMGSFLLLVTLVSVLVSARWYRGSIRREPTAVSMAERQDEARWVRRAKARFVATAGMILFMGVGVLLFAFIGRSDLPESESLLLFSRRLPDPASFREERGKPLEPSGVEKSGEMEEVFQEAPWPRFRGPSGLGIVPQGIWPMDWDVDSGRGILWRVEVPLPGNSSPILAGNRIFLTAGDEETRQVLCFQTEDGRLLWRTPVQADRSWDLDDLYVFGETGYAAPTPATDGRYVFALFATADVAALDLQGNVVWVRNMGWPDSSYGLSSSLVVWEDKLLLQLDRGSMPDDGLSAVYALDTASGEIVWKTPRPVPASWSSPIVVETIAGWEFITCADPYVISYDPLTGRERWRADCIYGDVAPGPVYADGLVFATNERSYLAAIRVGGEGDVTQTHIVWKAEEGLSDAASPIATEELLFQCHSYGILTCYDAKTGELLWDHELKGASWASPTLVGDKIYLPGEDGKMFIFPLTRDRFELEKVLDLGEPVFATPAFVDGSIYVRTEDYLMRIGE